jgi:hypothetical protein
MCDTSEFVVAALTSMRPPFDCHMFLLMSVMSEFQEGMEYSGNLHRLMDEFFYLYNLQEIEIGALMFFHLIIYFTFNSFRFRTPTVAAINLMMAVLNIVGHARFELTPRLDRSCDPAPPCGAPPRPHERFDVRVSMSLTPVVSTAWER